MPAISTFDALCLILKGEPSPSDVHVASAEPAKKPKKPEVKKGKIIKADDEKRMVYGWASIVERDGQPVVDHQGDVIHPEELCRMAQDFIRSARAAKVMHQGNIVGEVVESLVFTPDIQEALGIDLGLIGWFIGMHVPDDSAWKAVKDGALKSFSIGGDGKRVAV